MYSKSLSLVLTFFALGVFSLPASSREVSAYEQGMEQYAAKKYFRAARSLDEAMLQERGKAKAPSALFYRACCSFRLGEYEKSASFFSEFSNTFLSDDHLETACYMEGYALSLASPEVRLSQEATEQAIIALTAYTQRYPDGDYLPEVERHLSAMKDKLALKRLQAAKSYLKLKHYNASLVTLSSLAAQFPQASCVEEAALLEVNVMYQLFLYAENTASQLEKLTQCCKRFLAMFPGSLDVPMVSAICKKAPKKLKKSI